MNEDSGNLAVRALNHWRSLYMPTYIALRLFLQQLPQSKQSDYLEAFLLRKLPMGELCRYRRFFRFKGFDSKGEIEYREFYAASASSALGEAYVLKLLSALEGLANRSCVFSYQWPRNAKEGRSYRYFFPGYNARQHKVSSLLQTNSNYVVLVHDIKDFYPSIHTDIVYKRLESHISKSALSTSSEIVGTICQKMLQIPDKGVPIGPALGHIFGNIALEHVDDQMSTKFKDRYLRYVDDIFIVVEPQEIQNAQNELEKLIREEDFSLHSEEGKRDKVSSQEWLDNIHTEQVLGENFEDLFRRVRFFLWHRPYKLKSLQREFREKGIPMPLQRLSQDAHYGRFQRYMGQYIHDSPGKLPNFFIQFIFDDEPKLIKTAIQLRRDFFEAAKHIDVQGARAHGIIRKLRVQRLRYLLNRLLYLMPIHEFQDLLGLTPDVEEFFEYRSLIKAIMTKRLDPILQLPGPAIATFASLYRELGYEGYPEYDLELLNSDRILDSVCTLALLDVITVSDAWVNSLAQANSELVKFCQLSTPCKRLIRDQQFEDEIRTLQLDESADKMRDILSSRFSDMEDIPLEALLFSDSGS